MFNEGNRNILSISVIAWANCANSSSDSSTANVLYIQCLYIQLQQGRLPLDKPIFLIWKFFSFKMMTKWSKYQFEIYFARKVQSEKHTNKREKPKAKEI